MFPVLTVVILYISIALTQPDGKLPSPFTHLTVCGDPSIWNPVNSFIDIPFVFKNATDKVLFTASNEFKEQVEFPLKFKIDFCVNFSQYI